MNRGSIPGYYYDEQQKKYFKIQANHLVPSGAKYSKSNVKLEKRSKKKRKTEDERQYRREAQTIKQAPVLKSHVLGGVGLIREHALSPIRTAPLMQVERAFISQLQPHTIACALPQPPKHSRLQDAHYLSELKQMVVAGTSVSCGKSVVYATPWQGHASPSKEQFQGLVAFNSAVSTISTCTLGWLGNLSAWALVCASRHQTGNVAYISLPGEDGFDEALTRTPGSYCTLGSTGSTIGDSAIHPENGVAAIIGSSGIHVLSPNANVLASHTVSGDPDWPICEPCVNWINPNVLLYGSKAEEQRGYSVMLWDTRSPSEPGGKIARFSVRERLTGVFNAGNSGASGLGNNFEIFASTNHRIDLFDMRMPPGGRLSNAAVHSFKHIHGGPRLQRAATGTFLAAVDSDNIVQVYSTRTGTKMGSLAAPEWKHRQMESPMFRQLMWYDDVDRGLCLQAVRGNSVVRWCWGGGGEDEDDELE